MLSCAIVTIDPQQMEHPERIHSHKVEGIIFTHRFGGFQLILHLSVVLHFPVAAILFCWRTAVGKPRLLLHLKCWTEFIRKTNRNQCLNPKCPVKSD